MHWLNEPPVWEASDGKLRVVTGANTDFWRVTDYGFIRDNGHFYYGQRTGDFTLQARIDGKYEALYDQAGLMIRSDPCNWIKTGIEYTDGSPHLSAVVTRDFSDWSLRPVQFAGPVWLRLTRLSSSIRIQYSTDGISFSLLRLAYFPPSNELSVGLMCCSPQRAGFKVEFSEFAIANPIVKGLHET